MPIAVPIAIAAAGMIGSWLQSHGQSQQAKNAAKLAQQAWEANGYNGLLNTFPANTTLGQFIRGEGAAALKNPSMVTHGTSSSVTNTYQKSNPFVTSEYKGLEGMLKAGIQGRLAHGSDAGRIEASGVRNVNKTFRNIGSATENVAAATGGFGPSQAASRGALEGARGSSIADVLNQAPQIARANQGQDLGMLQGIIGEFGKGQESRGHSDTQNIFDSSQTQEGGLSPADKFRLDYELAHNAARPGAYNGAGSGMAATGSALSGLAGMSPLLLDWLKNQNSGKSNYGPGPGPDGLY